MEDPKIKILRSCEKGGPIRVTLERRAEFLKTNEVDTEQMKENTADVERLSFQTF